MIFWRYRYHGLSVLSEICIPEWSAFEAPPESGRLSADVAIRLGEGATDPGISSSQEYRFLANQAGWFIVRNGNEIRYIPLAGSNEAAAPEADAAGKRLRAFLAGSAWGALMYQRGALVLHASAVRVGPEAVAFCARRGAGKSTLAAMLSKIGYPLVSDDFCCVNTLGSRPSLYPSLPRLRLCEDAIAKVGWQPSPEHRDELQSGKYHYYQATTAVAEPHPLRRIYLLAWGTPEIHRLRGFNALTRLTSAGTWRGDLLIAAGDPAAHFSQYAHLLKEVECWEFRRPRDLNLLAESVSQLTAHMSE